MSELGKSEDEELLNHIKVREQLEARGYKRKYCDKCDGVGSVAHGRFSCPFCNGIGYGWESPVTK